MSLKARDRCIDQSCQNHMSTMSIGPEVYPGQGVGLCGVPLEWGYFGSMDTLGGI